MRTLTPSLISGKKVLLRLDTDVPIENGRVVDDFRLEAGMETLDFCLQYATSVIVMGHLGRPEGEDPKYSIKPVVEWLEERFDDLELPPEKLHVLENLRFEAGEEECSEDFAKELARYGEVFINESFAAHHKSASTTVLPKLLPSAAGFRFAKEVEELTRVRKNPKRPLVVIIGGAKIEDKLSVVTEMSRLSDAVLVGGKLIAEIKEKDLNLGSNVLVGTQTEDGKDINEATIGSWERVISGAKMVVWNGPLGLVEEGHDNSKQIAQIIIDSGAESIIGGGDSISTLDKYKLLDKFSFVSTGGGAMLKFLTEGTLPTIEVLS